MPDDGRLHQRSLTGATASGGEEGAQQGALQPLNAAEDEAVDVLEALRGEAERLHGRVLLEDVELDLAPGGGEQARPVD